MNDLVEDLANLRVDEDQHLHEAQESVNGLADKIAHLDIGESQGRPNDSLRFDRKRDGGVTKKQSNGRFLKLKPPRTYANGKTTVRVVPTGSMPQPSTNKMVFSTIIGAGFLKDPISFRFDGQQQS